ncbi:MULTISPECIES: RagB/SusD family nutrient uptake outer membrane protein [Sphingobacterium]|uniref:RagB/SusD family nutrient uptake outer membrane protein n=1 Tax=Sphingobacterium chuzhouense TaxID=1742264 RepID=A0ABR7XUN7_9SPHI|nr:MULTISPECIES: RagB/SusD family nutrient uptake outer membrane protein [Sphingobacterium]MBD1422766.1 RagB/SusD family nutrient uptake outer membrane protein [Sphingobacterium chuzhouense]NGM64308.1 RagB/SusD family nutrient uptake outer membrane protein [Sphingobacterium sp. SGR-19]
MKNLIIIGLIPLFFLMACNDDFLDRPPLDQVASDRFFEKPKDLETYVNQYYNTTFFPKYANHGNDYDSDDLVGPTVNTRLQGTRPVVTTGSIGFGNVRSVNYFMTHYKKIEEFHEFDSYKQYVGEAYYFKAVTYFNLLKSYGDIQWLDIDLGTSSPELYNPRTPRQIVADRIISCLDTAAMYLTADKTNGYERINKWIALLMQSRVALYEGTWQKYHNGTPFGVENADPNKYLSKAVEAAEQIMESGLYAIYNNNNPDEDYRNLFIQRDYSANSEVMFWRKYDNNLSRGDGAFTNDRNFRMSQPLGRSISKSVIDDYLCTDGRAITGNPLFQGYTTIVQEMENRDPRFRQTVASPDQVWKIQANGNVENWSSVFSRLNDNADLNAPTGYMIQKGYDPQVTYHVQQYGEEPSILFRYAEVLLNYIEAKAELGDITQGDIDKTVKLLRDRVGMPKINIESIATDPDWDFPALTPLINEIRRERRIELIGEGFRWDDIARWAAADELIVGKRPKGFKASQITKNPFHEDENGFMDPYQKAMPSGYGFKLNRDYLDPIPESQIVLNPENLTQNPGW